MHPPYIMGMYASYLLGRLTDVPPVDRGRGFLRPRIMHEEKGGRERGDVGAW